MNNKKLLNLKDPFDSKDSVHKKHVDDADNLKLNTSGGRMSGDIIVDDHRIWSTSNPTHDRHLARKIYVDERDNLKLNISGGTMTGDINMGNHHIIHALNYTPSSDQHVVNKKYVTNYSKPNILMNLYNLQSEDEGIFNVMDDPHSVEYDGSTKKIQNLFNFSKTKDWDFTQSNANH